MNNRLSEKGVPEAVCLGEALIDMISLEPGVSIMEASGFRKLPGGAPANVSAAVAKLGRKSAFVGRVGEDPFGRFLERTLLESGVDVSRMVFDKSARTGLAFVALDAGGIPEFTFYRNPSADMLLETDDLDEAFISGARIFHYGSISLISEPSRGATLSAARIARSNGAIISYDPNLRLSLWNDEESARRGMLEGLSETHIVKLSEEELIFLTGLRDIESGISALQGLSPSIRLVLVTCGPSGCFYANRKARGSVPGVKVVTVDTTGAGDAFVGAVLSEILRRDLKLDDIGELPRSELEEICTIANAVGALATTKRGAIASLPTEEELEAFLRRRTN